MLNVTLLPILEDNYCYILQSGNDLGIVDPGEAKPVLNYLKENNLIPTHIFITHHHWDHTNGIKDIAETYEVEIVGPQSEKDKIPLLTKGLQEDDLIEFGDDQFQIIDTPGHTKGHICYYSAKSQILFSGDTLFAMGCGRLFEGSALEMFTSFQKLRDLPDDTKIYCGHEYTLANAQFCLSIDPKNQNIIEREQKMGSLREQNLPTIPTTMELEKRTNIFMLANSAEEFKKLRDLKDSY